VQYESADVVGPVSNVTLTGSWHDQGWGNRYGWLSFALMRGNTKVCGFNSGLGKSPHAATAINKS